MQPTGRLQGSAHSAPAKLTPNHTAAKARSLPTCPVPGKEPVSPKPGLCPLIPYPGRRPSALKHTRPCHILLEASSSSQSVPGPVHSSSRMSSPLPLSWLFASCRSTLLSLPPALTADVKAGQPSENAGRAISLSSLHASSNSHWVLSQRNSSPPSPQALNELAPSILWAHCSPSHHTGLSQFLEGPVLPQGPCTGCFLSLPCLQLAESDSSSNSPSSAEPHTGPRP